MTDKLSIVPPTHSKLPSCGGRARPSGSLCFFSFPSEPAGPCREQPPSNTNSVHLAHFPAHQLESASHTLLPVLFVHDMAYKMFNKVILKSMKHVTLQGTVVWRYVIKIFFFH